MMEISKSHATDRAELDITDMAFGGEAVGRHDGQVVFVPFALPGERVVVELQQRKQRYLRGRVDEVKRRSERRTTPPCPYFRRCGGCQWQHADYGAQLEFKREIVSDQLQRIGGFAEPVVHPTLPSRDIYHYRNHARFTIRADGTLGFTELHSHRTLQIDYCYLMHPVINEVLASVQGKVSVPHQLSIRCGINTGDLLIYPALPPGLTRFPSGQVHLTEAIGGRQFRVSAMSFFQVNTRQAERMIDVVRRFLDLQGDETLVDAYSGVGTMALLLAGRARRVVGIEESRGAIADAEANRAGIENVELVAGKTEDILPRLDGPIDAVVLDPARVGCHPAVGTALLTLRPRRIVYVSCDPSTLARDLKTLCAERYRLVQVQPIDMFPQTYHIEAVARLDLI